MTKAADEGARDSGPRSIGRVLDLLLLLADERDGLTLAELSASLSVPKSTFLGTLRGLCERQYLTHDGSRYRLGKQAYRLAGKIVGNWSVPDMVRAQVSALARLTGESVGFAIADWELGQAIYTEAVNSKQPVRYAMQAGLRVPLYASAAGRVLLAFVSPVRTEAYLERAVLRSLTAKTRADPAALRTNLAEIRTQGFCASFGEMLSDTAAIAVPVSGPSGRTEGALILAAPLDRMRANYTRFLDAIVTAGHQVSPGRGDAIPAMLSAG